MILKDQAPLVLNITNFVSMNTCANMLLAIGASPLMAHATEELTEIVSIANSVVLNIGTLDQNWIVSMQQAQQLAVLQDKPIILDPVGAGASQLRTNTAKQLLQQGVSVVRGNASEILALSSARYQTRGVDSLYASDKAIEAGLWLSQQHNCTVVISGERDYICLEQKVHTISGGSDILTRITGMGCSATALIGAFSATHDEPMQACIEAMTAMKLASEKAATVNASPGSFYTALLDEIYKLKQSEIDERINQLATSA